MSSPIGRPNQVNTVGTTSSTLAPECNNASREKPGPPAAKIPCDDSPAPETTITAVSGPATSNKAAQHQIQHAKMTVDHIAVDLKLIPLHRVGRQGMKRHEDFADAAGGGESHGGKIPFQVRHYFGHGRLQGKIRSQENSQLPETAVARLIHRAPKRNVTGNNIARYLLRADSELVQPRSQFTRPVGSRLPPAALYGLTPGGAVGSGYRSDTILAAQFCSSCVAGQPTAILRCPSCARISQRAAARRRRAEMGIVAPATASQA